MREGKFQVNHGKFLPPAFMEGLMELVGLAMAVFQARGTPRYEGLLFQLPAKFQDSWHKLIQVGSLFFGEIFHSL